MPASSIPSRPVTSPENTRATGSTGAVDPSLVKSLCALSIPLDTRPQIHTYRTTGNIQVDRTMEFIQLEEVLEGPRQALDRRRGGVFTSNYEFPDRYRRFDIAFVDPPLLLEGRGRSFTIQALNSRGAVLLPVIEQALRTSPFLESLTLREDVLEGAVLQPEGTFSEEERSRQPSIFSVLRVFQEIFGSDEDPHLGLYGAFGYDLVFQFEPIPLRLPRGDQPDLVLYLPDELLVADRPREISYRVRYDFTVKSGSTVGLPREGRDVDPVPTRTAPACDHAPGQYQEVVETVREGCRQGDFFEVVPGQVFAAPCAAPPSALFSRLCQRNPSPYGFLLNLGSQQLIGASPEMFVRVEGSRVETCPIAGTIARGTDPLHDASQILELLNSAKDQAELTMCTDVDRNDKSRICVPGSVRVLGRRQVEMYSRVIHTVDHVEGTLRPEFDALDAFLSHTWAVTVTGAPKRAAMECIERVERTSRGFYGGAVGFFTFNGNINTGITIRTIRLSGGVAEVRAGATLLYDSVPDDEERETRTKASAMLDVIRQATAEYEAEDRRPKTEDRRPKTEDRGRRTEVRRPKTEDRGPKTDTCGGDLKPRVLVVDHEDSFVHTLANYLRQAGAEVITLRAPVTRQILEEQKPDLVFLSPGPGRPADFGVPELVRLCAETRTPTFGVCLGLQGMVEAFGGELGVLPEPVHGKGSCISHQDHPLFAGIPSLFKAGRYHSLFAQPGSFPPELEQLATSEDGVIQAIAHRSLPLAAVQFHPESILTQEGDFGLQLIRNALALLVPGYASRLQGHEE